MFTFVFSFTGQNRLTTETQLFIGSCLAQLNFYILVLDFTFITTLRAFFSVNRFKKFRMGKQTELYEGVSVTLTYTSVSRNMKLKKLLRVDKFK